MDKRITLDCTVRSQESNVSDVSKISAATADSKTESCRESKHSKVVLIQKNSSPHQDEIPKQVQQSNENKRKFPRKSAGKRQRVDNNVMMLISCGQLLLGEYNKFHTIKISRIPAFLLSAGKIYSDAKGKSIVFHLLKTWLSWDCVDLRGNKAKGEKHSGAKGKSAVFDLLKTLLCWE